MHPRRRSKQLVPPRWGPAAGGTGPATAAIVYATDEPGQSVVAAMDPVEALQRTGNAEVRQVAEDVRARLRRVLESVERDASASAPVGS